MPREAYVCYKCDPPRRTFRLPGAAVPRCATHGKMQRQANKRYKRSSVKG